MSKLNYKTFDQMMASVESDLSSYANEGLIDRSKYIKEARRVNADLGLKLNMEKEELIEVRDFKCELPEDFLFLQLALACSVSFVTTPKIRGIQTEAHTTEFEDEIPINIKNSKSVCFTQCDSAMWITQKVGTKVHKFERIEKIGVTRSSHPFCTDMCPNFRFNGGNTMNILSQDEASFSFREGKVYINYLADMVDLEGNVIILDHPLVNDYYEYAVKKKIFENFLLNKDGDFAQSYQLTKAELKEARIKAMGIVTTPEYGEIVRVQNDNRRRFYNRYVKYFEEANQGFFKV